jgi:hypothetical protein
MLAGLCESAQRQLEPYEHLPVRSQSKHFCLRLSLSRFGLSGCLLARPDLSWP